MFIFYFLKLYLIWVPLELTVITGFAARLPSPFTARNVQKTPCSYRYREASQPVCRPAAGA